VKLDTGIYGVLNQARGNSEMRNRKGGCGMNWNVGKNEMGEGRIFMWIKFLK